MCVPEKKDKKRDREDEGTTASSKVHILIIVQVSRCVPHIMSFFISEREFKNKKAVKRLVGRINHRDGVSQRRLAKIFDCSQPHICKKIKNKTNIRYRKKRAPKRTSVQKAAIRPKCRKLSIIFRKKAIIMDDESYFGLSNTELSGNAGFLYFRP